MRLNGLNGEILLITLLLALPAGLQAESGTPSGSNGGDASEQTEEPAATDNGNDEQTLDERLDALLSEVSTYEGGDPQRCLNSRAYRTVKVLNTEYLLFSRGDKYWLNKLKRDCPSLKYNDLPVFESRGTSSICQNDPFYPTNSMDIQLGLSGGRPVAMHGTCFLGKFEPIDVAQAALLTEAK